MDRLNVVLEQVHDQDESAAVMFLDLDHFKVINDGMGHSKRGCTAHVICAPRRLEGCRHGDTVARFGGDEFAILVNGVDSIDEIKKIADRVSQSPKPFLWTHRIFSPMPALGLSLQAAGDSPAKICCAMRILPCHHSRKTGGRGMKYSAPICV
ncbi:MAG: GGDEF domain-containing protein [Ignavibacteriales bacterium]|nr:GGDEF domain-containing protein [Ignavibacteriales bacterium]